ncbi:MAG: CTP synthase [Clostridia bacterium]|nr:CTP synthase [Clostridia bacterium]
MAKYIFVTGGVVSGLGKGITAASLGKLLRLRGYKVSVQKIDPYLNVDPGTMSPYEHGEVFVTDDGAETDLDIGHYERFLDINCSRKSGITSGQIYSSILTKERRGDYLGHTVQIVPHVTNEIKEYMRAIGDGQDIVIIEIGGTVGDMEQAVYIEAIRQFRHELGIGNSVSIHVTLIPYIASSGEIKTKPTQNSVKDLQQQGVFADVLVCRTTAGIELDQEHRDKIAMFCGLDNQEDVIHNRDCRTIYEVPLMFAKQNFDTIVLKKLNLKLNKCDLTSWSHMVEKLCDDSLPEVTIAIVGKYVAVADAYISVTEALKHAGITNNVRVNVKLVEAENIERDGAAAWLKGVQGVIVPGGFGNRGIEGKIATIQYVRENQIPFLGICLGMQTTVIEFARHVCGLKNASSTEFVEKTKDPVIHLIDEQKDIQTKGGTMRLGLYDCEIKAETLASKLYGKKAIKERHRHRYEFNNDYREQFEKAGLVISGVNPQANLVEIVELPNHPFFIACQFHPELISRPQRPHPLFQGLVAAVVKKLPKQSEFEHI